MEMEKVAVVVEEERRKPPGLLDVLLFVSVHYQVEGNLALGICKYTWCDELLWRSLIEMTHTLTDLNWKQQFKATRLMLACRKGRRDVTQRLCALGAKIEQRSAIESTSLMFACESGHVQVARFLIDEMHADVSARDCKGFSPLMYASQHGQVEMIEFLCDRHVDMEELDSDNESALFSSCYWAHVEAVRVLLARGANVDAGLAAIIGACRGRLFGSEHNLRLDDLPTFWARRLQVVRLLADHNANLNVVNEHGWTPLMYASQHGQVEMIEFLCDRHVDIEALNIFNKTALYIACYYANVEAVRVLLARGANVDAGLAPILTTCYDIGESKRKYAGDMSTFWDRRCEIVIELIRANANLHVFSPSGLSLLQLARSSNQQAIITVLEDALGV